jgi:uncharacterized membrane protein
MATVLTRVDGRGAGMTASLYLFLFPVPAVCFVGALLTDLAYVASAFLMWLHFSQWLLTAGIAFGIIAGIVLLIELISSHAIRAMPRGWAHVALFYVGLAVEILNALVHTADGWTAVMPAGLILSFIGAAMMFVAAVILVSLPARAVELRRVP